MDAPETTEPTDQHLVEVPVVVDSTGQVWALPACRPIPGSGSTGGWGLVEAPALDPESALAAAAAAGDIAAERGPGRHDVALFLHRTVAGETTDEPAAGSITLSPVPAGEDDPLGGWALAEELLGIDLAEGSPRGEHGWDDASATEALIPLGHAIEARLFAAEAAEDAVLLHLRTPHGAGVRVVEVAAAGSPVGSGVVLRLVAHGRDRVHALNRLHHALSTCAAVVADTTTNRTDLIAAVSAELAGSPAQGPVTPAPDPVAILVSAVRASDSQRETQRAAFHARAARGRPEPVDASGVATSLSCCGQQYVLRVYQTGPKTYRIDAGDAVAELAIERINDFEWEVTAAGRLHHVVIASYGTGCLLEIDGVAHQVQRDEGIAVRAQWPALIVSMAVESRSGRGRGRPVGGRRGHEDGVDPARTLRGNHHVPGGPAQRPGRRRSTVGDDPTCHPRR